MNRSIHLILIFIIFLSACQSIQQINQLQDGAYFSPRIKTHPDLKKLNEDIYEKKVLVQDLGDSIKLIFLKKKDSSETYITFNPLQHKELKLRQVDFDIDIFTIPFKIRPATADFPPQLNSNFNAAVYVGRRYDYYRIYSKKETKHHFKRATQLMGFGYGGFIGIGSTAINANNTGNQVVKDYEGIVLDLGGALIYDARIFNIGFAVGVDHLIDGNNKAWIYQHKPWVGILFGLNLN